MSNRWPAAGFGAFLAAGYAFAQVSTGTITGQITDSSGASVPRAAVRVIEEGTNTARDLTTDSAGIFRAPNLLPGRYRVDVSIAGFQSQSKVGLVLTLDQTLGVNFTLEPGEQKQSVTVVGRAEQLVSTETSSLGEVIEQKQVQELPLNGRNFQLLLGLNAGVQPGPQGTFSQTINVNGGRGSGTSYLIDGLDVNSPSNDAIRVFPNLEAIGEFKILTNAFTAEYGRSSGGIVNTHIKSGTNAWHGSLFEFFRNKALNAKGFFDAKKNPYNDNQFGGSAGGRVIKDKLFVFADYQGQRTRQSATVFTAIASAAQRTGDFSAQLPGTVIYDPLTNPRVPIPGNIIPQNRIDKPSALMFSLLPQPNAPPPFNYVATLLQSPITDRFDGRVDYHVTDKNRISVVITRSDLGSMNSPYLGSRLNGNLITSIGEQDNRSISLNYTRVLTASIVNEFVAGFTRDNFFGPQSPGMQYEPDAGVRFLNTNPGDVRTTGFPMFLPAGFSNFGGPAGGPYRQPHNIPQATDNFSLVRGRHAFKTGFAAHARQFNVDQSTWPHGLLNFSPLFTSNNAVGGHALASALFGYASSANRDFKPPWGYRIKEYGAYFQDDFKVNKRLTLNLGLRWDLFTPATESHGRLANFDIGTLTMRLANTNGLSASTLDTNWRNFGPHAGFAYQLTSDGKTVVRGGYEIGYVPLASVAVGVGTDRLTTNPPFVTIFSTVYNFQNPTVRVSDGLPLTPPDPNHPAGDVVFVPQSQPTSYSEEWNFGIQRALPHNFLLDVSYAGAHGAHLAGAVNLNQAPPAPTPPTGRSRISNNVNNVESLLNHESSIYHSLQMKFERRFAAGFYMMAAYTLSKSIDDGSYTTQGSAASSPQPQDAYNWRAERALSDFDDLHRLVISYIYELPFGRGKKFLGGATRYVNGVLGGWQVNGITVGQSGMPFTPVLAVNVINSGPGGTLRPNRLASGNLASGQDIKHWFDPAAFAAPGKNGTTPFVFGNSGRNILRGPDLVNFDFSVFKSFRVMERARLEFRSEFFNIFNHPNFNLPNASVDTAQAGIITAAKAPRQIQFALKLLF